ncbi:MAG: hypothetical protein IJ113_06890 [Eggerthellaceae bacterium]|nr:hypothetical protein [Eggerthellaceae bacterium]
MDCKCVHAKVSVSGDIKARLSCNCSEHARVSIGTVTIRDGTNDYEKLVHKPSIEGVELVGDRTLEEFGETPMSNLEIKNIFDRVFKEE